jgi:hypothetical protein
MMSRLTKGVSFAALLATLGLAGCSGGDGDDDDYGTFTGTWLYVTGERVITCPNLGKKTEKLQGTLTVSKASESGLVVIVPPGCALRLSVSGNAANVNAGPACAPYSAGTLDDGTTISQIDSYQGGSFVVNGKTATMNLTGSAQLVFGATEVCTFTVTGATLNKP